jgi:hypothetical protein
VKKLKKNYFFEICFDKEDNFLDMYSFLKIPFFDALAIIELTLLKDFWISSSFFASTDDLNLFRAFLNLDRY